MPASSAMESAFHLASDLGASGGNVAVGGNGFPSPLAVSSPAPRNLKLHQDAAVDSRTSTLGFLSTEADGVDYSGNSSSSSNGSWSHSLRELMPQEQEPTSRLEPAPRLELSPGALTGIILAAAVLAALVVGVVVWLHVRRRKSKSRSLSVQLQQPPPPAIHTVTTQFQLMTDNEAKISASRQNSLNSNGGPPSFRSINDEMDEEFTDYGSVLGSFPPSPTLSFRSVVDGPGFSRSRSGTGTSFGTVASFTSDWTRRSRASTTASFRTCLEEDVTNAT